MSFVKIDSKGWDKFTGDLGFVPFEDGVSVRELTQLEIARIGASIRLVKVGTDEQVGASVTMVQSRNLSAEVVAPSPKGEEPVAEKVVEAKYDRDALEVIASEGGIKAIRAVANEFNVKGVEINKMIEDILKAQLGGE